VRFDIGREMEKTETVTITPSQRYQRRLHSHPSSFNLSVPMCVCSVKGVLAVVFASSENKKSGHAEQVDYQGTPTLFFQVHLPKTRDASCMR
jgi:hypothetical protein